MKENGSYNPQTKKENSAESKALSHLIIHNDDYNTFDYVIECLVEVCDHNEVQAEQCAYITHFKGKCDVKSGEFEALKPLKDNLIERGLNASIE